MRPNALSVSPRTTTRSVSTEQSSRGEECQTSTRDQGEQPDGRVHRRTRCRKRQRAADEPRFNGSVLSAYIERSRYVCPSKPYRPSCLQRTVQAVALGRSFVRKLPKDLSAKRAARVAHALHMCMHMFTVRVACEPGSRKCATAHATRKSRENVDLRHPTKAVTFFTFTPPQAPCRKLRKFSAEIFF